MSGIIDHDNVLDTDTLSDLLIALLNDDTLSEAEREYDDVERTQTIVTLIRLAADLLYLQECTAQQAVTILRKAPSSLISDDHFETWAQEYATDIGAINEDFRWPANHIDWEAAAAQLQMDYSSVAIEDKIYWVGG